MTLSKHPADDKAPASSSDLFLDRNTLRFYWDNVHTHIYKTHTNTQTHSQLFLDTQPDRGVGRVWLALPAAQLTLQVVRALVFLYVYVCEDQFEF